MMSNKPLALITEHEAEKASNAYLMSLVVVMAGIPLPIINVIATLLFLLSNRRSTYFVRWHCLQAMFSQLTLFGFNSAFFWWTIGILWFDKPVSNDYFYYLIVVLVLNLVEFIATIYTAIETRKGIDVRWWLYADVIDSLCEK